MQIMRFTKYFIGTSAALIMTCDLTGCASVYVDQNSGPTASTSKF